METIRNMIDPQALIEYGKVAYSPRQVMYLCADIEELLKDTGYVPDHDFESGIRETIAWMET